MSEYGAVYSPKDIEILARTIYGEARGEKTFQGKIAVAWVILNRSRARKWYGESDKPGIPHHTIAAVCLKRWQFSCWNDNDPNRKKIESVKTTESAFVSCLRAAAAVMAGLEPDPTDGSDHYHTKSVKPDWSKGKKPAATIGNHVFFNDIA